MTAPAPPLQRPAFYGRVSVSKDASDYQHEVEGSVDRQFHEYLRRAEREPWGPPRIYRDEGISAYSGARRPEFERLIRDIEADLVDVVVFWKLDRLIRRLKDYVRVWDACQKHGVRLVSLTQSFDTSDRMGVALAQMGVVFAELESGNTSERVTAAYDAIRRTGKPLRIGRRPFGWAPDRLTQLRADGELTWTVMRKPPGGGRRVEQEVTFKPEADLLCEAGQGIADGTASLRSIVVAWDARRIRTTTGHRVDQTMLRKMLLRPGNEPIFGPELNRRLQAVLTNPGRRSGPGPARKHVLSGFLTCPHGGHKLTGQTYPDGQRVYHCPPAPRGCGKVSRLAEPLERLIGELVCRLVEAEAEVPEPAGADASDEERAAHERLRELALNLERYDADYKAGQLSARERNKFIAEDTAEIEEINRKLRRRQTRRTRVSQASPGGTMRQAMGLEPGKLGTLEERRTLIASYLKVVGLRPVVRGRPWFDPAAVDKPVWQEDINTAKASAIWQALVQEAEEAAEAASVKTHCPQGHPYDEGNTYWRTKGRWTYAGCRECQRAATRRHYRAVRAGARPLLRNDLAVTRCPKGHLYDEANTYVDPIGRRQCRECRRIRRKRAAA